MTLTIQELKKTWGVGLTGGIATGKSTLAKLITDAGYLVIDADALARDVVAAGTTGLSEVLSVFGPDYLLPSGELDRKRLGARVFADLNDRQKLEAILHPRIAARLSEHLAAADLFDEPEPFFYEAALLFETGQVATFREIWVSFCPYEVQLHRLMTRDKLNEAEARRIIAAQMRAEDKAAQATRAFDTTRPIAELAGLIQTALAQLDESCHADLIKPKL